MRHITIKFIALASAVFSLPALAEDKGHIRFISEHHDISFNADSTYSFDMDITVRAIDQIGVNSLGQQYFSYQRGRQEASVLLAETLTASGQKIAVPEENIKTQDGIVGGVTLPEQKVIQLTFPKLAVGDAIHYRYRLKQIELDIKGGSSTVNQITNNVLHDDFVVSIDYPEGLPLRYDSHLMEGGQPEEHDGHHHITWRYHNTDTDVAEYAALNSWQHAPYVMASTFASWSSIANSYQEAAAPKAAVTDEVRELANTIVDGKKSERDQVHAIYDWVRSNIRYVASYIGNGGWVPHDTHSILQNRFGDCKDHATLLEALLEARGIAASQVLILANNDDYTLTQLPTPQFNHDITYVPSLNLFLDSTADQTPFGILPEMDADKPVLVTKHFVDISHTPEVPQDEFKMLRRVQIKLAKDGSADRVTEITGYGRAALSVHEFITSIGANKEAEWVKEHFANAGLVGSGKLEALKSDNDNVQSYRYTEHIQNYLYQPQASTVGFNVGLEGPIAVSKILRRFSTPTREADFVCKPFKVIDDFEILMPKGAHVVYAPKDQSIHQGFVAYEAHLAHKGDTYKLNREWGFASTKSACTPAEYQETLPAMEKIRKALGGSLMYVMKDELAKS